MIIPPAPDRDLRPYTVGAVMPRFEGRRLFTYHATCPSCQRSTFHETRAAETATGWAVEVEVCSWCRRIRKVAVL